MKRLTYSKLGETVFRSELDNGLTVFVDRKPGFGKSYAFFATNYGGNDTRFRLDGVWQETPAGVAHFLEHKMFDTKDGNALQELAANGASPNAFTSSAITGYYFECTQHFEDNLRILLSFVSVPWFTKQSVDKEQGIIGQEIRMIEDNPSWRVYVNLMTALYHHHPIRTNVAGTVESISHITEDTLYRCHKAFYSPDNMVLCVAGDVDPERVVRLAEEVLPRERGAEIRRDYGPEEPETVCRDRMEERMEVSAPQFLFGVKLPAAQQGEQFLRRRLLGELTCAAWLGSSSPLYARLYREGKINDGFSYGYEACPGCAFLCAGGESRDPEEVCRALVEEASRLGREGIDPALWQRLKRAAYGSMVRQLNSFQNLCVEQAEGFFRGYDYLTFPELFESIREEDARQLLLRAAEDGASALSVIRPKGGEA